MNYVISSININYPLGKNMDRLQTGALFLSRQKSFLPINLLELVKSKRIWPDQNKCYQGSLHMAIRIMLVTCRFISVKCQNFLKPIQKCIKNSCL